MMKDKLKKAALVAGVSALTMGGVTDANASNVGLADADAQKVQSIDANTRRIVGKMIGQRVTDVHKMAPDGSRGLKTVGRYVALYMDTDNDGLEDYIAVQLAGDVGPFYNYPSNMVLEIIEVKDNVTGRWLVDKIVEVKRFMDYVQTDRQK